MKINKLTKKLEKLVQTEMCNGFIRIDEIKLSLDGNRPDYITIKGAYGKYGATTGEVVVQRDFELMYPDGKSLEFIAGMLYQHMHQTER